MTSTDYSSVTAPASAWLDCQFAKPGTIHDIFQSAVGDRIHLDILMPTHSGHGCLDERADTTERPQLRRQNREQADVSSVH